MTSFSPFSPLALFDTLRAEDETAWLGQVYVPPQGFETMRGMRSVIVFGEEGSGKTALRLRLIESVREAPGTATPLIVEWQAGVQDEAEGETFVKRFVDEILDLTAQSLAFHLARQPQRFTQASRFAQEGMVWLIHQYLRTDKELLLLRIESEGPAEGLDCLREILNRPPKMLVPLTAPYPRQMTEVVRILDSAGLSGLWVMMDGLDAWLTLEAAALSRLLTTLFSSLVLFDIPGFAVKVMAPLRMKNLISTATGLTRRRFEIFELDWPADALRALCERRLVLACGREPFGLDELSSDPDLLPWLAKYGGASPRGWLEFLRPFVDAYLQQPARRPLTPEAVADLQRRFPPRLRMDAALKNVFLGHSLVAGLSESSLNLLRYLYTHPGRACDKEELYYRGLRGLDHQPRSTDDPAWEPPDTVEGVMDTALWRLRQALEPNPKQPVYVVSERGKGVVRLENVW
ncbi:MAG: hypothetical protein ABWK53_12280 [Anaerolineales bacterium]